MGEKTFFLQKGKFFLPVVDNVLSYVQRLDFCLQELDVFVAKILPKPEPFQLPLHPVHFREKTQLYLISTPF